ncbi:MAG: hypothetical protein MUP49_03825 [Dehalococcoidia bacterium]|nr:hypothetical protein [Dehalococcoidia bacterium]
MDKRENEERFMIIMEEVRDALVDIETQLEKINDKLGDFGECVETRTKLRMLRVIDMNVQP